MDDREVVAAIAAGDPAGIAVAYDKYAAGLYGYCHWMLHGRADADEALQDTFVIAATLGDLPEAPKLRPWLYAVARNECLRRLRAAPMVPGEQADAVGHPADAADHAANPADQPVTGADQPTEESDPEQAELQRLIRDILAELEPDERAVIELSLRHDLYDTDLATALGVSWSQAHALTSRARRRLEKDLGVLLIVRTGREDCPALGTLLADWDGQLTEQTRELVGEHIEQCGICAGHRRGALRQAALSGLQPSAGLPPGLRDDVLRLCTPITPDIPMYRRSAGSVRPSSFSEAIRAMRWDSLRSNPGTATAAIAVVLWVVAVVSIALLTLTGSHSAHALPTQSSVSAAANNAAAATTPATGHRTTPATTRRSGAARPSPTGSQPSAYLAPTVGPSASPNHSARLPSTSPSQSPKPSKSPSSKPSKSPSPSSSPSPSPSPSKSALPGSGVSI